LHADGFVEVFADDNTTVHVGIMPHVAPEGERLAAEFFEQNLPQRYRNLYWPGNLKAADVVRSVKPSDLLRRRVELDVLKAVDRLAKPVRITVVSSKGGRHG
jgi:hypothetical protein